MFCFASSSLCGTNRLIAQERVASRPWSVGCRTGGTTQCNEQVRTFLSVSAIWSKKVFLWK